MKRVGGVSLKEEGSLWNPGLNAKYFTIEFHYFTWTLLPCSHISYNNFMLSTNS